MTTIRRRGALAATASLLALPALSTRARAQAFPDRPIRFVVGFPPGGVTDIQARAVAAAMQERLGQPVVVENRAGAASNIAAEAVARAAPDGYTLVAANNSSHGANQALFERLPFDPVRDFTPIALTTQVTNVLVVHPSLPAATMAEYAALSKARPAGLNYASAVIGSAGHLAGEMFKIRTGANIVHVPFRGAAPAVAEVIAGRVESMFGTLQTVLPGIRGGQLRALGVTALERIPQLPEVPTMAETVAPGFFADAWFGIAGPAGIPRPVVDRLAGAVEFALARDDVRATLTEAGMRVRYMAPDVFAAFIAEQVRTLGDVARASGARAE